MKKLGLLIILLNGIFVFSQDVEEKAPKSLPERKHEIKVGAVKLLAGPIFEGTYEYINSKKCFWRDVRVS